MIFPKISSCNYSPVYINYTIMKHKSSRIVALIALYILIIFGIFVIQFTVGKTFSYTIGSISVSGRHEVDKQGNTVPLLPLHIVSNGLNFYITEQNPIITETKDGKKLPVKVTSYIQAEDSFTVECSGGVSITFTAYLSGGHDSLKINVKMPAEVTSIYFPWKLSQTARLEREDNRIFLRYGKNRYIFKGGYGFENSNEEETEQPHLVLSSDKPAAFYETYIQSQSLAFESIPNNHLASDEIYNETKKSFRDKALIYLENTIFSRSCTEEAVTAYVAETASRNQYQKAIKTAEQISLPKEKKTYKSCTFFDNLIQNERGLALYDNEKLKIISADISQRNISVFENKKLIEYLVDHSKKNLIPALQKITETLTNEELNAHTAAGILEAALDYPLYFPNTKNVFMENAERCEKILKDSFFSIDEGLFISSDAKHIDTKKTLDAAEILIRYGKEYPEKRTWKFVGQMLYSSILQYSGESASLPAYFDIQGNAETKLGLMANDTIILNADKLYRAAVTDNQVFPHKESLSLQAEHGIWAWSSANAINIIQNTAKIFSFRVDFKQGETHYLIIRGIRPFYRIQIHGIDFRSDQRFEIYNSSGYVYNERTGTLLLKLKHKKDNEEITLFLGRAPAPAPLPVPTVTADENNEADSNTDGSQEETANQEEPEEQPNETDSSGEEDEND